MKRSTTAAVLGLSITVLVIAVQPWAQASVQSKPLVVFFVRHAEKTAAATDPALTADGENRAKHLAIVLGDARVQHVHSTDYVRTRTTAVPLAKRMGLKVNIYDPSDLVGFAKRLKSVGGRHLVVGHSNTTPRAVAALGGESGSVIQERGEYDRLYVVTLDSTGAVTTVLMRYGKPFKP